MLQYGRDAVEQMPEFSGSPCELNDQQFSVLLELLGRQTGRFSIEAYKSACVKRRIVARIRRCGCRTAEQYQERLLTDPAEADRLISSLSIHVSQFFRNPTLFDLLQQTVLPQLVAGASGRRIQCWSAGCSAGQEPYSLAMLVAELSGDLLYRGQFGILATDVDGRMLALAEQGRYTEQGLQGIPPERRERFCVPEEHEFRLSPEIRDLVRFSRMDLQQFDDYRPADLVLCRNTLIYFNRPTQEKILHSFADILPQDGILVLGKSESMPAPLRSRYVTLDPVERIYGRR